MVRQIPNHLVDMFLLQTQVGTVRVFNYACGDVATDFGFVAGLGLPCIQLCALFMATDRH